MNQNEGRETVTFLHFVSDFFKSLFVFAIASSLSLYLLSLYINSFVLNA
jgi:hypothetical protein